ncbi:cAMP-dependent protein kinase type II regulatory subunit [Atheta coriaria]|uniref:cAMP-dependent protein kinase type II regulatory subunit n=1 Tax=Dalotia coriaria TaxID=877792 RepID=UPI0031F45B89
MSRNQGQRVHVPDDLREVLLEFTITYLLEQPGDVINYAAEYFTRLRDARQTDVIYEGKTMGSPSSPEESIIGEEEPPVARFNVRRKSVFAETYDPEEDDDDEGNKVVYPKSDEQRQQLAEAVKNILLFRPLEKEQMNEVFDAMFERKVVAGESVIKQGDDGDNFYVIHSGIYQAWVAPDPSKEAKLIHTYQGSGSFGELALMYNMPRAATIIAQTDGSLWAMDRQTFRRILLKSAFKKRKMYEILIDSVPMLKALQKYERMNLADALVSRTYTKGQRIIKQNDVADGMYFVESGTISIKVMDDSGQEVEINTVGKGGYFGELALVTHRPRAASAYAAEEVKVAFLDVETFERLLGPCMQIMKRNIHDYEEQMLKIFGSHQNIRDIR